MRRAFTVAEISIATAIGVVVLVAVTALFSGGQRLLDTTRRVAGSQVELQNLMEALTADAAELSFVASGAPWRSGSGEFACAITSSRFEAGQKPVAASELRRVQWRVEGGEAVRSVQALGPSRALSDTAGPVSKRTVARMVRRLTIVPVAWKAPAGKAFTLSLATGAATEDEESAIACLAVNVAVGEASPSQKESEDAQVSLTVRLWCRDRLLALGREGVP